jgi:hypothetical protein
MAIAAAAAVGVGFVRAEQTHLDRDLRLALAFTTLNLRCTVGVLTNHLAFRLWTLGLVTFPGALRLLTDNLTFRSRRFAVRHAFWLLADCETGRTVAVATLLFWTFDFADGLCALNIAHGTCWRCAASVTTGSFAYRFANRRTVWVIALPSALWVAILGKHNRQ